MIEKHNITIEKTARYFTKGELNEKTKGVIFLLHGYAQPAIQMVEIFSAFSNDYYLIAPEGLNRFYARGFKGDAVANWMTSAERDDEIKDYTNYLDKLYKTIIAERAQSLKIIGIGFSQGVATLSRWVNTGADIDQMIMIGGGLAVEFVPNIPDTIFKKDCSFIIGNEDPLVDMEKMEIIKDRYNSRGRFLTYTGRHQINEECLNMVKMILRESTVSRS